MKTALIVGVSSQDGSYLAELLLEKGYRVVGTIRRSTSPDKVNISHLYGDIKIEAIDLIDSESINAVISKYVPDEIYNLAAQSVPGDSWTHPIYTGEVTALGPVRVFESARKFAPHAKIYQATSREIFGNVDAEFANEDTKIDANNPYGISKAYAHMMVNSYRESYGMFVCAGILFNHESPRRSLHFVTRKVTVAVACIKNKPASVPLGENGKLLIDADGKLHLGDLLSQRDWGYAKDYVEAMWLMLQRDTPKDYVIGTGESHSVKELCEVAFARAGLNWEDYVVSSSDFMRPTEIKYLRADSRLALKELGWKPTTSFKDLIELMVDEDLKAYK